MNGNYLSFDLDWAPEHVLEDLYSFLKDMDACVTVFVTHHSQAVQKISKLPNVEIGLHPNFLQDGSKAQSTSEHEKHRLAELKNLFPQAEGLRSHDLYSRSGLLKLLHEKKIAYVSNEVRFLTEGLQPFYDWTGMVQLPIFWEDDIHCLYMDEDFSLSFDQEHSGIRIFNFHPIHIYLNTPHFNHYKQAKDKMKDEKELIKLRYKGKGVRSIFKQYLEDGTFLQSKGLLELKEEFCLEHKYRGHYHKWIFDRSI